MKNDLFIIEKASDNECSILDNLFAMLLISDKEYDCNIKDGLTMNGFFSKRIKDEDSIILVAKIDNNIVGYIYGYIRSDNKIKKELESYIESLFIIEEYRNKGIGTTLINKFIDECKSKNVKYIFIENKEKNESAKFLYNRLGFQIFIETRRKEI